jgi:hypothetical protein
MSRHEAAGKIAGTAGAGSGGAPVHRAIAERRPLDNEALVAKVHDPSGGSESADHLVPMAARETIFGGGFAVIQLGRST